MSRMLTFLGVFVLLAACREDEPGPTVMVLSTDTDTIEIAANQLRGLSIYGEGPNAALGFRMGPDTARAFSDLTLKNIGSAISISICGDVVSTPIVREHIAGGSAQITGYSVAEFEAFMKKLDGSEPC